MTDINRTSLNKVVKSYLKNGDVKTAKSYIQTWGTQIKGFNIEKELRELDKIGNKKKTNKRGNK